MSGRHDHARKPVRGGLRRAFGRWRATGLAVPAALIGAVWLACCLEGEDELEIGQDNQSVVCEDGEDAGSFCCTSWREDVQPVFESRCSSCHSGSEPAGRYDVTTYVSAVGLRRPEGQVAKPGEAGSRLLSILDPNTSDGSHQGMGDVFELAEEWVVGCRLSYFRSPYHPGGVLLRGEGSEFHGLALRDLGWAFDVCSECHGDDLSGGESTAGWEAPTCYACHAEGPTACDTCHGNPPDTNAHPTHVLGGELERPFECEACHITPMRYDDVGHILNQDGTLDESPAEVTLGALAQTRWLEGVADEAAAWSPETGKCTNVYCHGADIGDTGAVQTTPTWLDAGTGEADCGACHGIAPANHAAGATDECHLCHDTMEAGEGPPDPERHVNGSLEVRGPHPGNQPAAHRAEFYANGPSACQACHGGELEGGFADSCDRSGCHDSGWKTDCTFCHGGLDNDTGAPPWTHTDDESTDAPGVGAHTKHVMATDMHEAWDCETCHAVPASILTVGHIDGDGQAEVQFDALNPDAVYDLGAAKCSNSYCHGTTLEIGGGLETEPVWTMVDGTQAQCDSCHGRPPPPPHAAATDCGSCHPTIVKGSPEEFADRSLHINGIIDMGGDLHCNSCHGSEDNSAPPVDILGSSDTSNTGVGAHQSHLEVSDWHKVITCDQCHTVPLSPTDGHNDGTPAELTFGGLAQSDGALPQWTGTTCAGAYCHGTTLSIGGGNATEPVWTMVDGTQAECDSCHGWPPPPPHTDATDCGKCHPTIVEGDPDTFADPSRHIDGIVDVDGGMACNSCHGGPNNSAPPVDTKGNTDTSATGVGAHQSHLGISDWHNEIKCDQCHRVPQTTSDGHNDGTPAELTFGDMATKDGASPQWSGTSCGGVYCHGTTLSIGGGDTTTPVWTTVDGSQSDCGSCHGRPPPPPHVSQTDCGLCHPTIVAGSPETFADPSRHIDGVVDVEGDMACNSCHGGPVNNAPPVDTSGNTDTSATGVGAHQVHLTTSDWHKAVTCDECHREPQSADDGHNDGTPAELTFGTLAKLGGASPSWNGATCGGTYCHGTTVGGGGVTSPRWTTVDGTQTRCDSCHGCPPPPPHAANSECGSCHPTIGPGSTNCPPNSPPNFLDASRHIDGKLDWNHTGGDCQICHFVHGDMFP